MEMQRSKSEHSLNVTRSGSCRNNSSLKVFVDFKNNIKRDDNVWFYLDIHEFIISSGLLVLKLIKGIQYLIKSEQT